MHLQDVLRSRGFGIDFGRNKNNFRARNKYMYINKVKVLRRELSLHIGTENLIITYVCNCISRDDSK